MNILSFGSLNLDYVYRVQHIVRGQETIPSVDRSVFCGGKGLNQSAAAYAGCPPRSEVRVFHAGCIGKDGAMLTDALRGVGVDTRFVRTVDEPTGHAIIQVSDDGENAIIVHGGANHAITESDIIKTIDFFDKGDIILLQNEISATPRIMEVASDSGGRIFFNAAPCDAEVRRYPLALVHTLIVNEIEGGVIAGKTEPNDIIDTVIAEYPHIEIIVTIGAKGALYGCGTTRYHASAHAVEVVDTTAAGDTFVGYYAALVAHGHRPHKAMEVACCAASLSTTNPGALPSIPQYTEVLSHL